jgi:CBS domain-containing protein
MQDTAHVPADRRGVWEVAMLVRDAMSTTIYAVTPEDPAAAALQHLVVWGITGLPVVDTHGGVRGVITELDLLRALRHGADLHTTPVSQVMQWRPIFVEPETDLYTAAAVMEEWQVQRLPVCERGRIVGIISRGDVLRALASDLITA